MVNACLGVLPHVPRMLPVLISDPEMRERVAETFTSEEFINNIESYFVQNIKVIIWSLYCLITFLKQCFLYKAYITCEECFCNLVFFFNNLKFNRQTIKSVQHKYLLFKFLSQVSNWQLALAKLLFVTQILSSQNVKKFHC